MFALVCCTVFYVLGAVAMVAAQPLWVVVDGDDDDRNTVTDHKQFTNIPVDDLVTVPTELLETATEVRAPSTHVRLLAGGHVLPANTPWTPDSGLLQIQGVRPGNSSLELTLGLAQKKKIEIHVVALRFLDGRNRHILPAHRDLFYSGRLTNDGSLPSSTHSSATSEDPRDFRFEFSANREGGKSQWLQISIRPRKRQHKTSRSRSVRTIRVRRHASTTPFLSTHMRLVADEVDLHAPGTQDQTLKAALLDQIRLGWTAPNGQKLSQDIHVGLRQARSDSISAYRVDTRVHILRTHSGGPPVVGLDEYSATTIAEAQIETAGEIWAQCGILFNFDSERHLSFPAPPPPALLSISNGDGLPATGDGTLAFTANGVTIGPVATVRGHRPLETAMALERRLATSGFIPTVTVNPRTQFGVGGSADIVVRNALGQLASLQPLPGHPVQQISTDSQQRLAIATLDLRDGLAEFRNMNARAGTLEERLLLKTLADPDPATIDIFFINRFSSGTRQGEAFIERSEGPLLNAVIIDRVGLRQRDNAWTLAHELGHVLLDAPLHPDNIGPDRPWLLMDADSSRGSVYGPKRLTVGECHQALARSGPGSLPALLSAVPYRRQDGRKLDP